MAKNLVLDRIALGKCEDLLASLPDESVDLVGPHPPTTLARSTRRNQPCGYVEEQGGVLRRVRP